MSVLSDYLSVFLAVIVTTLIYYYYKKNYKIVKFLENFPIPPTVPFFGNALDFPSTTAFLPALHKYTSKYGNMIHLKIGLRHTLLASDSKFLEFLLSSNKLLKKTSNLNFLLPWLGKGLFLLDGGPEWKFHRRLLTPAFHFKILEQFVEIFDSATDVLVEKLTERNGSKSLDIYPYVSRCTLDIICETAMGTKIDVQNNVTSSYFHSVKEMGRIFIDRSMSIFKRYDFIFRFTDDYKIQQESAQILHNYTNQVIDKKRQNLNEKKQEENTEDSNDMGLKKRKVFLDLILDAPVDGQGLSREEIRAEVDTFMFAGHGDTTATASSFILYCIANNKEVQNKLYEEQKSIFGNNLKNAKVTYYTLQDMKYLENTIKEGLRLYSPAPVFGRQISEDVEYDGMIIPKGLGVMVFVHGIHMNPEYYPNPEKFDPSRFETNEKRPPFAYIPFSAGPRNCIGQKYAIVEIKTLISKIVRNFELFPASPEHHMELAAELVLKSRNGVKIGLKSR